MTRTCLLGIPSSVLGISSAIFIGKIEHGAILRGSIRWLAGLRRG